MLTIALLPVDGRPVTREMPVQVGAVAGVTVLTPPTALLGFWKEPGDRAALRAWLQEAAVRADAVVAAGDMLAYGGLVPSRILPVTAAEALESLGMLKALRAATPGRPIYLFNTVMRISNADSDIEEPPYWAEYGTRFWRWSYETDRGDAQAAARWAEEIPAHLREGYLALRQARYQVNLALLDWVREGVLDLLVFPQDDCARHGFHVRERNSLMAAAATTGVTEKVLAYPGADEVASALVARAIHHLGGTRPRFWPVYSSEAGPEARTKYEDIPLGQTVAAHIRAAGGEPAAGPDQADLLLAVHSPAAVQGDWYLQAELDGSPVPDDQIDRFVAMVAAEVDGGRAVALADVCYANGADPALMERLLPRVAVARLAAFSGWNTAGNTLGSAVALAGIKAVCGAPDPDEARDVHASLLLTRLSDDYLYQSTIRPRWAVAKELTEADLMAESAPPLAERIRAMHAAHFANYQLDLRSISFPWHRAFEVRVDLKLARDPGKHRGIQDGMSNSEEQSTRPAHQS